MRAIKKLRKIEGLRIDDPKDLQAVQLSENDPITVRDHRNDFNPYSIWFYKGVKYDCYGTYTDEEFRLLILEDYDNERKMFEKLSKKFDLDNQNLPAFGQVSISNLKLILSGPGASGSRPMPDGRQQEPGGWNRIVLQVEDLPARIADLKKKGVSFRNEMEIGPGGKQIQVEDPDGNPIELFEPARR